jgi:anti-sigma B factor antagonist
MTAGIMPRADEMKAEKNGLVLVVELEEDHLDTRNVDAFKNDIKPFSEGESFILLDLSRVRFVDSSGLGAILSVLRQLSLRHGKLKICNAAKSVRVLFDLVRLDKIIDIYETSEAALSSFPR